MRDGWRSTKLGELFAPVNNRLGDRTEEPDVLSITKYDGLVLASEYFDKRIASRDLSTYKVVRSGDFVYSTIHIDEGSIARNNLPIAGVVSPMYTVMRLTDDECDPRFLELALRAPQMLRTYFEHAAGTVNRRRSLSFRRFAQIELELPSPGNQLRIVDLISTIDHATAEASGQSNAAARALEGLMAALLSESGSDEKLGNLVDMRSGPSWKAADEGTEPVEGSVPVIKITNTRPDGELDLAERVFVKNLPESTRRLNGGSLLMIRTNGNRDRIGNVYRVTAEAVDHAYSAFQIGIFPKEPAFSDYLYWFIRSPAVQTAITDAASGTTGLGNIALSWLRELPVPWPDEERRLRVVQVLDSVEEVRSNALIEVQKLKAARAAILSELLSGKRTIPDSYDRFLQEAS